MWVSFAFYFLLEDLIGEVFSVSNLLMDELPPLARSRIISGTSHLPLFPDPFLGEAVGKAYRGNFYSYLSLDRNRILYIGSCRIYTPWVSTEV